MRVGRPVKRLSGAAPALRKPALCRLLPGLPLGTECIFCNLVPGLPSRLDKDTLPEITAVATSAGEVLPVATLSEALPPAASLPVPPLSKHPDKPNISVRATAGSRNRFFFMDLSYE